MPDEVFQLILFGLFGAGILLFGKSGLTSRRPPDDAAFDEDIKVPVDREQLARLKPLIAQIGILEVPGEKFDAWLVFVSDVQGATHDVYAGSSLGRAKNTANGLAAALQLDIDDPGGVLR